MNDIKVSFLGRKQCKTSQLCVFECLRNVGLKRHNKMLAKLSTLKATHVHIFITHKFLSDSKSVRNAAESEKHIFHSLCVVFYSYRIRIVSI